MAKQNIFVRGLYLLLHPEVAQREAAAAREQSIAKSAARGWVIQCHECGVAYAKNKTECPKCTAWADSTLPRKTQLLRVYAKGDILRAFQQDAAFLAALGWQVQSQSQGGLTGGVGVGIGVGHVGIGVSGGRRPKQMTVVYTRS